MPNSKRDFWPGVCGAVLGAVYFGLAGSAMAWNEPLWVKQLGTADWDDARGVATDAKGNVYLTGTTVGALGGANYGLVDAWVAKYDATGNVLWKRQLGTADYDSSDGVATDAVGNVYLTGTTVGALGGANLGIYDAWVVKYDATGNVLWKRQLGTADWDDARGVATDAQGNVYLIGATYVGANYEEVDAWVAKYDPLGHLQWKRQLGTADSDHVRGVATDAKGNVYLTGTTFGASAANDGLFDAWVVKYDATGNVLWKRQLGTADSDARGVATDAQGNIYLTGTTYGPFGGTNYGLVDAWVVKYDATGNVLWKRRLGSADWDNAGGVATDAAGNVYLTGITFGALGGASHGLGDAWVAKYDPLGHLQWKRQLGSADSDYASGVATDAKGNVYLTGITYGALGGTNRGLVDAWVAKYSTRR